MNGDLIISTSSHQIALVALLNEHASMYGLKVKTWERNLEEFPGGYSYHRKREFMKQLIRGLETGTKEVDPYIFHMSWYVSAYYCAMRTSWILRSFTWFFGVFNTGFFTEASHHFSHVFVPSLFSFFSFFYFSLYAMVLFNDRTGSKRRLLIIGRRTKMIKWNSFNN